MAAVDPVSVAVMVGLQALNQRNQARAANRAASADAANQRQTIQLAQDANNRKRRDQLRRIQATQRARFGAQGLRSAGGSAAAVLSGFEKATNRDIRDDTSLTNLRLNEINRRLEDTRRANLLAPKNFVRDRIFGEFGKRIPMLSLLDQ